MASIEVSLSTTPRRKNSKKSNNGGSVTGKSNNATTAPVSLLNVLKPNTTNRDPCKELEVLRNALKDKENTIQTLQGQVNNCGGRLSHPQPLEVAERKVAEQRLKTLKQEEEAKKLAIKNINLSLEQIDESESNIDVRIRQAELEYELGREELGLLGVREEARQLQARLDAKPTPTLYSCVVTVSRGLIHAVQIDYDPKSPVFGAGNVEDKMGLYVLWASEASGLQKGDRVLEVNGKLTLSISKEEMLRLLTVCPTKAELVVFRVWSPPATNEDVLRRENLRLSHRISYLEDQVSELLTARDKLTNIVSKERVEVFQKGPQVTLLSNAEVTKPIKHSTTVSITTNSGTKVLSSEGQSEPENYRTFQPKSQSSGDKIKTLSKKYEKDEFSSALCINRDAHADEHYSKSAQGYVSNSSLDIYSYSDLDKRTHKLWKENSKNHSKVIDFIPENTCPRYKSHRDRSVKSLDLDCEVSSQEAGYGRYKQHRDRNLKVSEADLGQHEVPKPTLPKKPVRLSIHRATSLQNVELGYPSYMSVTRKLKRSHKGEAPQPPAVPGSQAKEVSRILINGGDTKLYNENCSRINTWNNWHHGQLRNRVDEKWC